MMEMNAVLRVWPKFMATVLFSIMPKVMSWWIGIGGVGSWAVEALARTGIGELTLVDMDVVAASNINRQLPANELNFGAWKKLMSWQSVAAPLIHVSKLIWSIITLVPDNV